MGIIFALLAMGLWGVEGLFFKEILGAAIILAGIIALSIMAGV